MLEHLMYKALFELSHDRAEFVSRLFSRKRPAGLDARASADDLFRAFERQPADRGFFDLNLRTVIEPSHEPPSPSAHRPGPRAHRLRVSSFFREGPG